MFYSMCMRGRSLVRVSNWLSLSHCNPLSGRHSLGNFLPTPPLSDDKVRTIQQGYDSHQ